MGSVMQIKGWVLAGIALLAGLALVVVLYTGMRAPEPVAEAPAPVALAAPKPEQPLSTEIATLSDPAPSESAPSDDMTAADEAAPPPPLLPPAFDVVRVAEDGGALVAGSAAPDAAMILRLDGEIVAETAADDGGQFVAIFTLKPSETAQLLTLEMVLADGRRIAADDRVVLAPRPEAVATLLDRAPEAIALAIAQPEDPGPPLETAPPLAMTAAGVAQVPGHAEAAGALLPPEAPGDEAAPLPETGSESPRAAPQGTDPKPASSPGAGAEIALAETTRPDTRPLPDTFDPDESIAAADPAMTSPAPAMIQTVPPAPLPAPDHDAPPAQITLPEAQPPGHEPAVAVLEGTATADNLGAEDAVVVGAAPAESSVEAAEEAANLAPRAFVLRGSGRVAMLDSAPEVMDNIVIDTISYSDLGDVQISGRASTEAARARVQIYLDNQPIATAQAQRGDWVSDLPAVDPGVYVLRVDQLDDAGQVVSRFETPFQREDPARVRAARAQGVMNDAGAESDAASHAQGTGQGSGQDTGQRAEGADPAPQPGPAAQTDVEQAGDSQPQSAITVDRASEPAEPEVALMTVQPGHSLWRISEGHYGEGIRYLVIYNANQSQIRNPDLIYPGQIFVLPD